MATDVNELGNTAPGFLRLRDVQKIVPVSKSSIWAWCQAGQFPRPHKLGPRITAWLARDVHEWVERKAISERK